MRYIYKSLFAFLAVTLGVICFSSQGVKAASANISNSYKTSTTITSGSLVSLDPTKSGYVIPANTQNFQRLTGVVTSDDDSLLEVNVKPGTIQVALSGSANVLVSTINGSIAIGDQIAVSPIDGVGMKAVGVTKVIGIALSSFSTNSSGAKMTKITDIRGHTHTVAIGYVPVTIAIGTSGTSASSKQSLTSEVQKFIDDVAGRNVSYVRIIVSVVIAFVSIVALVVLIYGSINGSILAVGRNPLAKPAIFQALAQTMTMTALIVIAAIIIIYFILI